MTYQVLARKWRPQVFDAVVGQDAVTRTLRNALASGRVAHAYLFTGPRGVGKTTTARLLAKALACTARAAEAEACGACASCVDFASGAPVDVIEIDAASNNGVEEMRTLRENVKYAPARGRFKVYIVDEVHMLSGPAFNAFLKTLEEPPAHVVFILATTDPRKIPLTVLSRCQRFDFRPIAPEMLTRQISEILTQEQVDFDPAALPLLVRAAEGSLRDALSLLDAAIAYGQGRLEEASVAQLLGSTSPVQVRGMLAALVARDGAAALEAVDRVARQGEDLDVFCRDVIEAARRVLVIKAAPSTAFADLGEAETDELAKAAESATTDEIIYLLRALLDAQTEMRRSPHPRVELEIAVVRGARRPQPHAIETLIAKVEEAEKRLRAMSASGPAPARVAQESLLDAPRAEPMPPPRREPVAPDPPRPPAASARPAPAPERREPAPPPPTETVAPDPPADADPALAAAWQRVVDEIQGKKPLLGSVLLHARPVAVRNEAMVVAIAGNHFHKEQLTANRELITQAVRQHVPGAKRFEIAEGETPLTGAINHPVVRATLAAFPGEVVSVRPRTPESPEEGGTP
jgi:DNA polymerase-3 subunit gamma/tau